MKDNLLLFNIPHHRTQFIHELKYQVHNNPKKYSIQTAKEVESIFIHILLKSMRNSSSKDDLLGNNQSRLYTEIYDQELSQAMSKKGIGLTDIILKQIQTNKNPIK
ncbi:flagellar biosynthesis protein FlgJ [Buchnera aphidicola (Brachycaudus cardui)]|uniref:Flagellar biosynthesis protein FlgJ n=1 Tax=Buchnera aphidicola (Brachycaudus cardui) TaxID=557993 RepID=A0A4D6Y310_9GAMM|nr:rod-binding protein [Buchnera aphidicola]QCI20480.1 flagellar biosynthesis protein FlgJ [Buchnera aphidicola (Brachycaudus cardui)]